MKIIILAFAALMLQGCLKTYSLVESDTTTKLVVNDISLPEYQTFLFLNSMETVVTIQDGKPSCPFDGGFSTKNHLGDIRLTKNMSSKVINLENTHSAYATFTVTENIANGSKVCKSSMRIDPKPEKKYKLSVNGQECTAALYEARSNSDEYIRSNDVAYGGFRDERLCI